MARTQEPVAVLGIGAMGHGMATSALRAGIPTIVWNREPEATRDLAELGAEVAESAADAARRAAIVVTMVTDTDAVMSIARDQGMLAALAPGAIWVQMSTIGVAGIERVAALVDGERPDVMLVDAPVSGSKDPAAQGQLTIFASGPDEARSRVAPLFDALGQRTIWVGAGRGRVAAEGREQHLAGVRGGSGRRLGGPRPSAGARDRDGGGRPRWRPARVSVAGGQAATDRQGRVLRPVRAVARAQGRAPRPAGGRRGPVRRSWRAWPTNGNRSSIRGSATRTSPS